MIRLHKAVFIGVTWGIVLLITLASMAGTQLAYAATQVPAKSSNGSTTPPDTNDVPEAPVDTAAGDSQDSSAPETPADCDISASFPDKIRRWCDLVVQYANSNGLDPNLVAAVMLQESGGNAGATSHSGAIGLLQVMPRDGIAASFHCANGPCFASRPSMAELYDPEFNLRFGTGMLAGLVNKKGDLREALRAYGPGDAGYTYADKILAIYQRYR